MIEKKSRNDAIDLGRAIGSFAVISAHIAPGDVWTERLASVSISCHVPFFYLVAMVYFVTGLKRDSTPGHILKKQSGRILVPFLAWSVIYIMMLWVKSAITGQARDWTLSGVFLYGQGAIHLYFLTVLFWMQVVAVSIYQISKRQHFVLWSLALAGCILFAWWGNLRGYIGWNGIFGAPLFILTGWWFAGQRKLNHDWAIAMGLLLFITASILNFTSTGWDVLGFAPTHLIGAVGFYLILANLQINFSSRNMKFLLSATYGVYLSHFIFLEGIEFVLQMFGVLPSVYTFEQETIFTLMVFALALVAVFLIRKFPVPRRILLGET